MVSRDDDYEKLALAGCEAVCEPAFWAGFDRSSADGFHDYFRQLTEYEPKRAARYGIKHFSWLCINPKEADNPGFAREVMSLIPQFLKSPTVLGIGEIGLNKNTRNELTISRNTSSRTRSRPTDPHPHPAPEDNPRARASSSIPANFSKLDRKVIIDHVEEHTVSSPRSRILGGMTLYPHSKCSLDRAIDILETHGPERLWMNSACDWGVSDPLAVPKCALQMKARKHDAAAIERVVYQNPKAFLSQSPRFVL
jgi:predicted metal-dependent TIM-barrel fold hydrolase